MFHQFQGNSIIDEPSDLIERREEILVDHHEPRWPLRFYDHITNYHNTPLHSVHTTSFPSQSPFTFDGH